jgi:tRNA(fMet)-specific endonuclease VapC
MGLILDTSVLIAAEKKRLDLQRFFAAHPEETFFLAAITCSELLHGVIRAQPAARKQARAAFVEALLAQIETIDFDLPVARRHAALWAELEKKGRMIGPYDLLIAATGLHHDHALVTLNTAEFRQVPKLRLADASGFALG